MDFISPDWAPNIHPLIIHFPIGIIHLAVLFHFLTLVFRKREWFQDTTIILYVLGAVSILVTYITGRQAADSVVLPPLANPVLTEHADLALWTLWYFGILALVHIVMWWKQFDLRRWIYVSLFVLGAGGLILIFETAEYGAKLVYKYGVGVQATPMDDSPDSDETGEAATTKIVVSENGSWYWEPAQDAREVLEHQFIWIQGKVTNLHVIVDSDPEMGTVLSLHAEGTQVMFVGGESVSSVQVDLKVKMGEFEGEVMLVHHVQNELTYDFLSIERRVMKLGRMEDGREKILQEKPVDIVDWVDVRVVGDGKHFRGYLGDKLVTHGHIDELPSGKVGFRIDGIGTILVDRIQVQSLR